MKWCFLILVFLPFSLNENYNSIEIRDLSLRKCYNKKYPVTLKNIKIDKYGRVGGSLSTDVDLDGPIKASVLLKRRIIGIWIPIACRNNVGSCTYTDLCRYAYSECPGKFIENNVPCSCPIPKGNYTIPPSIDLVNNRTSILSGTYGGRVVITQDRIYLACYNFRFVLYDYNDVENYMYWDSNLID